MKTAKPLKAKAGCKKQRRVSQQIMSTVFHELRTPLSSINGYASILLTAEMGKLNKKQSEAVEKIRHLCSYLTSLINNLLEISMLETATFSVLKRNRVDLGKLAGSIIETLSLSAKAKDVGLSAHCAQELPCVWGNEDDLGRVYINLLSNAIKFTPKGGSVKVEIAPQQKENNVIIKVSDTGIGLSQQAQAKVFQEFYHEDNPDVGAVGGAGLGLSIVKKIVEAHKGRVWLQSQQGKGTTVSFTVPLISDEDFFSQYFSALKREIIKTNGRFNLIYIGVSNYQQVFESGGRKMLKFFLAGAQKTLAPLLRKNDRVFLLDRRDCKIVAIQPEIKAAGGARPRIEKELAAYTNSFEYSLTVRKQIVRPRLVMGAASFPNDGRTIKRLIENAKKQAG